MVLNFFMQGGLDLNSGLVLDKNRIQQCRAPQARPSPLHLPTLGAYLGGALCRVPLPPPPPRLTMSFSKKEQNQWCQVTEICQTLLMVSVPYSQGRNQGGRMRVMHPPTSHFQKCFCCTVYSFLIISNFFDSDKSYALRAHNRKCANKMRHI